MSYSLNGISTEGGRGGKIFPTYKVYSIGFDCNKAKCKDKFLYHQKEEITLYYLKLYTLYFKIFECMFCFALQP